ncbi:alpha/beta hydrolase [Vulgatibacter incomptus]|uniref:Esterase n=1 Tax=Vulgatibacter incomptus TaxID=1391653 RepID=A0A0K1PFB5_9BACT|nr:YqiA/YcfP family alpha/beta fold hydrolase [Vulgatibacter incomptus]AKU92213.1 hypothetical protein AKJ08_2600 [Vulgatibacter incomptus]
MRAPGVVYLHGFASSPTSEKARFFRDRLAEEGIPSEIPDLNEGPGGFSKLTLTRALEQTRAALSRVGADERGAIVIGSSLGGYLAALTASRDPRVLGAVLLAPAFDLPGRWNAWLGDEGVGRWRQSRELDVQHHAYGRMEKLGFGFYLDAMGYPPYPRLGCPALILHGVHDREVGIGTSRKFAEGASDVRLVELDSDHGLLDVKPRLWEETTAFLGSLQGR